MKRLHVIFTLITMAVILSSCSAQKQLYNLLQRHPELRTKDSVVVIDHTITLPAATNTIFLPHLVSDSCNCDSILAEAIKDGLTATAGNAQAALLPTADGIALQATQLPDTIYVRDTTYVPQYIIKEAPREDTNSEVFFRISGIIAWLLVVLAIVVCLFVIFMKR